MPDRLDFNQTVSRHGSILSTISFTGRRLVAEVVYADAAPLPQLATFRRGDEGAVVVSTFTPWSLR